MGEFVFLGIILAICGYFYYLTYDFAISPFDKSGGAALFPRIVLICIAIFVIIRIIQVALQKEKGKFVFGELFRGMRLFFFASFVIYVALLDIFGYIICTILFLAVTINVFYKKVNNCWGPIKSIVIRNCSIVVFTFAMEFFFSNLLGILLPNGFWAAI